MTLFSRVVSALVVLAGLWLMAQPAQAQTGKYTQMIAEREAVQKGVDFLTQGSVYWIRDRGCFTCHAVGLGAISSGINARNGYVVNQHEYDTMARFVLKTLQKPNGSLGSVSLTSVWGTGFAMGCRGVSKEYAGQTAKIAQFLLGARGKDGKWMRDHPDKRELIVTGSVMTSALAALVIQESAHLIPDSKFAEAASAWSQSLDTSALTSTPDLAFALLGKATSLPPPLPRGDKGGSGKGAAVAELKNKLFALQNADGGWPTQKGEKSNLVVTSQALFALGKSGATRDDSHVSAAVAYLFGRQRDDGTWVPDGQGKEFNRFVPRFTRTAWATIGLSTILEVNSLIPKRAEILAELQKDLGTGEEGLFKLARAQLLLRDTAAACQTLEKLTALVPGKPALRLELARAFLTGGDKTKAAAAYQQALQAELPADTRLAALQNLAECLEDLGDKKAAGQSYVQLVDPRHAHTLAKARRLLPKITALAPETKVAAIYGLATNWEVSGPFAIGDDDPLVKAYPPEKGESVQWQQFVSKDPFGVLDLTESFKKADNTCGFARLQLTSAVDRPAQLRLSSDGSVVVWLNGKEIHRKQTNREIIFDQDKIEVTLPKGNSTILVKVCQNKGRWGLACRLTDKEGKPLDNVQIGSK